jgi:hypothetical protein
MKAVAKSQGGLMMRRSMTWLATAWLAIAVPVLADGNRDNETANAPSAKKEDARTAGKSPNEPAGVARASAPSPVEVQIQQLKEFVQAQEQELEAQRAALREQQRKVQALEDQLKATYAPRENVPAAVGNPENSSESTGPASNATSTAATPNAGPPQAKESAESPVAIRFKGITLTPGGFFAAETVFRNRATSGDINTSFTGIPFPGNALSKVTENNFTARQTRATLAADSKVGSAKVTGYFEMDFLGAGTTSNNRQSNSYVFRQRQLWAQAAFDNGWSVTGGQMWTLATENRKGIQNRGEALPMQIDPQYVVGFTWARQYGFRVVKDFGGRFALGVSVEGPQTTIGGRGFSSVSATTVGTASVATTGNFFINAPGSGGGLFNAFDATGYTVNKAPDFLFKAAIDPGFGHYELFGIVSVFRNRIYPCGVVGTNANDTAPPATPTTVTGTCASSTPTVVSSFGAFNDTRTGGGFGASARWSWFAKKVDFSIKGVGGDGIGRYGSAQLADTTARPDGTLALIRTAHGLGALELHPHPKLDVYFYYGAEYGWRAAYQGYNVITVTKTPAIPATATTSAIPATTTTTFKLNQIGGYGSPFANNSGCSTENSPSNQLTPSGGGTCAGDIRLIQEWTIGFWHKFYSGPKGRVQWGLQYSYIMKSGWSGNNSSPSSPTPGPSISPKAVDNMLFTSFRYYLP